MTLRRSRVGCLLLAASVWGGGMASAQSFESDVAPLVETSCLQCHGARTVTPLNLERVGYDLTDPETFKVWEKVYERLERGEMPPASAREPDRSAVETALGSLQQSLVEANVAARGEQRTPLRRLTRLEYGYTLADLLFIDEAIASEVAQVLPAEADSGGFDTTAVTQSMSPLHVQSYLTAADRALDAALVIGAKPELQQVHIDYVNSPGLNLLEDCDFLACGAILKQDDGFATFTPISSTFMFHSMAEQFFVTYPGRYRVTVDAYPYNAKTPVNLTMYSGSKPGSAASLDALLGELELVGDETGTLTVTPFLRPGDLVVPSLAANDHPPEDNPSSYFVPTKHVRDYVGEGLVMKSMSIDGPLFDSWPPRSTRALLPGIEFDEQGEPQLTQTPHAHMIEIVGQFATRAFRRPLGRGELESYVKLATPLLADGQSLVDAVRVSLRAVLSSPAFLYQAGGPGTLDDYELATRLSYFLWRSMPDQELFDLADAGQLSDDDVLAAQVERMLDDERNLRFVKDFGGQAFRLYELRATLPDPSLYPTYDDRLAQAMERETEMFLTELIASNEGISSVIDADFTFVNRQLAEHYGLEGIEGERMRRVSLPKDSPRGGLMTQASILKVTANGTTTSPVPRGNFVLSHILGQEPPPPPPGVAGLEPDIRGTTTVREQLDAHRNNAVCASCHRKIDPPGFALEAFDAIGEFRTHYKVSEGWKENNGFPFTTYADGPVVDASGVTPQGDQFTGIQEYKELLLDQQLDQVARHLTTELLTFSTGAKVEFADRASVEHILAGLRDRGYPIRTVIRDVVTSPLFRSN